MLCFGLLPSASKRKGLLVEGDRGSYSRAASEAVELDIAAVFGFLSCGGCGSGLSTCYRLLHVVSHHRRWLLSDSSSLLTNVSLGIVVGVEALHDLSSVATFRSLKQGLDVDGELDGVTGWSGSEVVLSSLEATLPGVEVHG